MLFTYLYTYRHKCVMVWVRVCSVRVLLDRGWAGRLWSNVEQLRLADSVTSAQQGYRGSGTAQRTHSTSLDYPVYVFRISTTELDRFHGIHRSGFIHHIPSTYTIEAVRLPSTPISISFSSIAWFTLPGYNSHTQLRECDIDDPSSLTAKAWRACKVFLYGILIQFYKYLSYACNEDIS